MMMTMRVVVVVVSPPLEVTIVVVDDVVVSPPLKFRIPQLSLLEYDVKVELWMTIAMMTK